MKSLKDIVTHENIEFISPWPGGARFKWYCEDLEFFVIATDFGGKDHVSVSHSDTNIAPTISQMLQLKNIFFFDYELTDFNMKKDDDEQLLLSNCYHIHRDQKEFIFTFNFKNFKFKE
ncbi:MAG TPA: hypothetical protein H9948_08760 [Candidatus Jeotgalibaca merdavium]|uniref:Uncharacterized protein n=1 Tax=Candidatus Jeotgalibaca merdavium TaxID=2838627 RepID=A0A9D2I2X4_9LACT|nr:hypothetical protein [Candidatus Jeotgalibaca merdavium]